MLELVLSKDEIRHQILSHSNMQSSVDGDGMKSFVDGTIFKLHLLFVLFVYVF